jgi:hypothetical protein
MSPRATLALAALMTLCLAWGCNGSDNSATTGPPTGPGPGGGSHDGGAAGNGAAGGAGGAGLSDGGQGPVYLSVDPNPAWPEGEPPDDGDVLLAKLTTYAAGARAAVVALRWSDVDEATLAELAAEVADHRAHAREVTLVLLVVDGIVAHKPDVVAGAAWDDSETVTLLLAHLDAIQAAVGSELFALVLGREVDAYQARTPRDAAALGTLLSEGVNHLGSGSTVGVGLRYRRTAGAAYTALLALGSAAVFSYFPAAGKTRVDPAINPASDLDSMISLAAMRPVLLESVGFTSAEALGASLEVQRHHLETFVSALLPRRGAFPLVNLHHLHDRNPAACATFAAERGYQVEHPLMTFLCAAGLRQAAGEPKEAWYELLSAAATLSSP